MGTVPRLFLDLTTAYSERGRHPHGTTRIERGLSSAIAKLDRPDIGFCRYSRSLARFVPVSRAEVLQIATLAPRAELRRNAGPAVRRHPLVNAGRRLEAWVRAAVRNPVRNGLAAAVRRLSPGTMFSRGATLVLLGELQRHDFGLLADLRRRQGVNLVFVFTDLIGALEHDDPRLNDASAKNLPGAEFMIREGTLLLSISRFSASTLADHLAQRGKAPPPIEVIDLAGTLPADHQEPVDGLAPGGFVLSVGDIGGRKNQQLLLRVWAQMAKRRSALPPLVLLGRITSYGAELVTAIKQDPDLQSAVRILPNASDEQLAWCYANCRFTAFPSVIEGFGLPVAESLAAGKMCVASSTSAIPEASQGFALHLDPQDETAWLSAIEKLLDDDELLRSHERQIRAGFQPVTWDRTAAQVLAKLPISVRDVQSTPPLRAELASTTMG